MAGHVVIAGRPNVGKSTLFNRLAGRRRALVDGRPGVTRDRREAPAQLGPLLFNVADTAGLAEAADDDLAARMHAQTEGSLSAADVILFLLDARAGVTPEDHALADRLRGHSDRIVLVANKAEGRAGEGGLYEAFELGLGTPVPISAEHGEGLAELAEVLMAYLPAESAEPSEATAPAQPDAAGDDDAPAPEMDESEAAAAEAAAAAAPVHMAVAGRPNVGKSTLINALLGHDRLLTGPEPGITRDAIAVAGTWRGRSIRYVDTAGLRKKAKVTGKLERLAAADGIKALGEAEVVVLVIDAQQGLERQDLTIAARAVDEGRALVLAVNKWDVVDDRARALAQVEDRMASSFQQVRGVPIVALSAATGQGLGDLMDAVLEAHGVWNRRVSTGRLNRWLEDALAHNPPPMVDGRRLKIRFGTQVKARPPTFAFWANRPEVMPDTYRRYLINGLRETFGLDGVPVRLYLRKGENPYV